MSKVLVKAELCGWEFFDNCTIKIAGLLSMSTDEFKPISKLVDHTIMANSTGLDIALEKLTEQIHGDLNNDKHLVISVHKDMGGGNYFMRTVLGKYKLWVTQHDRMTATKLALKIAVGMVLGMLDDRQSVIDTYINIEMVHSTTDEVEYSAKLLHIRKKKSDVVLPTEIEKLREEDYFTSRVYSAVVSDEKYAEIDELVVYLYDASRHRIKLSTVVDKNNEVGIQQAIQAVYKTAIAPPNILGLSYRIIVATDPSYYLSVIFDESIASIMEDYKNA